jgi:hypothetical protein
MSGRETVEPVKLGGERLMFMQPDMDLGNFGVDDDGSTVVLNFAEIAVLPECFAAYTLSYKTLAPIAKSLGLWGNPNVTPMAAISRVLRVMGDRDLVRQLVVD